LLPGALSILTHLLIFAHLFLFPFRDVNAFLRAVSPAAL